VAGVCRGLADRFGVPVAALRLMFIGSIFFGGWGILAYLALWIAMPVSPARALNAPTVVPPLKAQEPHFEEPQVEAPLARTMPAEMMPSP
jgi:phage shock protein PspC (stress-responsive transcriptional regulator)